MDRTGTSNQKSKPKKLAWPFLFALFHLGNNLIKFGLVIFLLLPISNGWEFTKKLAVKTKKSRRTVFC